ncbi:MAG: hypothetical protein ABI854_11395 [Betaproteobacteria bacterium]
MIKRSGAFSMRSVESKRSDLDLVEATAALGAAMQGLLRALQSYNSVLTILHADEVERSAELSGEEAVAQQGAIDAIRLARRR